MKTKSGSSFAASASDWAWLSPSVPAALRALHAAGYALAVFSNQGGIQNAHDGKRAATARGYFGAAFAELRLPVTAFLAPSPKAAAHAEPYRKGGARTGMWAAFARERGAPPDVARSFYVGDAAGRPGDHGAGDREFASAVGLAFYTPEEAFGGGEEGDGGGGGGGAAWLAARVAALGAGGGDAPAAGAAVPRPLAPAEAAEAAEDRGGEAEAGAAAGREGGADAGAAAAAPGARGAAAPPQAEVVVLD